MSTQKSLDLLFNFQFAYRTVLFIAYDAAAIIRFVLWLAFLSLFRLYSLMRKSIK